MFEGAYWKLRRFAEGDKAPAYLYGLTFCESSFFPIPTDVMLAPMCALSPERAWRFAWWTTIFSVMGGVLGYLIGYFFFHLVQDLLSPEWMDHYEGAKKLFDEWGGAALFFAALTPFPFKVATIAAGTLEQNLLIFCAASFIGRAMRFYLVALLSAYLGPPAIAIIEKRINFWGWVVLLALALAAAAYVMLR